MEQGSQTIGGTLGGLIAASVRRWGDRPALVCGDQALTYAELGLRCRKAVAALADLGLARGSAIALLAPNGIDVMVATAAAMLAGIRTTPLSMLASDEDLAWLIADSEVDAVCVHASQADRLAKLASTASKRPRVLTFGAAEGHADFGQLVDAATPMPLGSSAQPSDIAVIGYTGGTTGRPKGVVHSHRSALAAVMMATAEWEWPEAPRVLAATPVSHAAGILAYPTWLRGGTFHLLPAFSPESFEAYVRAHRIGCTFLVPTMIYRLLDHARDHGLDLGPMETILYGAAPMAVDRLVEALNRFGPIFMQLYGQTEAPTCISYLARAQHQAARPDRLGSVGVPLAALDLALLDDEGRPAGDGEPGEICVRGAFVMEGYWKRPDETAEALRGGWLHTGDVGRFDADGYLHLVDRKKDLIISGGFNIYPREVEDVIGAIAGVRACAVVGVPDPLWGEAVTAAIVADPDAPDDAAIIAEVKARRGNAAAPKRIVRLAELPQTAIGKIDKKILRSSVATQ